MSTIEERVAFIEGKVEEYSRGFGELRDLIIHLNSWVDALDQKLDRFREELATSIDTLKARLTSRIDTTNARIDNLEARLSGRLDSLDEKFSRFFLWTIGIQITVLLAVIGVLLSK